MRAAPLAAALLAASCASPQPLVPNVRAASVTWKEDVAPLVHKSCDSCHTGADPAAGFRTDSYLAVITKATAGDPASPLLTVLADSAHSGVPAATVATVKSWVVDGGLAYEHGQVHPGGIMNPADPDFHGALVKSLSWDLSTCAKCHGSDFAGGKAGVSCKTCHTEGPTACDTCHGQPPASGAHVAHVTGAGLGRKLDCSECHVKPATWNAAGHPHDGAAKITFGALAGSSASYDAKTQTCSGVACHGDASPTWSAGSSAQSCGTCHGLPPASHQNTGDQCVQCHSSVVDAARNFVDASKHVNGVVDLGAGTGCASCHGQPPATGAHLAHVNAEHKLAPPVACSECHVVPATVDAPGHIDQNVQVVLARGGSFDPATQSCSASGCHLAAAPVWTAGAEAAGCGTCHAVPPAGAIHAPTLKITDCATCHAATVDASGALIVGGGHMNGVVDVNQ